jgi:hypothetical protein
LLTHNKNTTMKKRIKLKESELINLIKRVVNETEVGGGRETKGTYKAKVSDNGTNSGGGSGILPQCCYRPNGTVMAQNCNACPTRPGFYCDNCPPPVSEGNGNVNEQDRGGKTEQDMLSTLSTKIGVNVPPDTDPQMLRGLCCFFGISWCCDFRWPWERRGSY